MWVSREVTLACGCVCRCSSVVELVAVCARARDHTNPGAHCIPYHHQCLDRARCCAMVCVVAVQFCELLLRCCCSSGCSMRTETALPLLWVTGLFCEGNSSICALCCCSCMLSSGLQCYQCCLPVPVFPSGILLGVNGRD